MKHISILGNDTQFGNFCWPSVARLQDSRLVMVCSGHRLAHVCPFGKVVACVSEDDGLTWSEPITLIDTPLDDRDAGITPFGDGFIVTTFNNTRAFQLGHISKRPIPAEHERLIRERVVQITDEEERAYLGSSYYYFGPDMKERFHGMLGVSAPHGMSLLSDGRLMYVGREAENACISRSNSRHLDRIGVIFSEDGVHFSEVTWLEGLLPGFPEGTFLCEPHGIELRDGRILILSRVERPGQSFTIYQSVSRDGGKSFSRPMPLCIPEEELSGSPPHLLEARDGTVILTYGYRLRPYGQRARISRDGGETWSREIILREDGVNWDLGYPATVERTDGSLLTVYYQIPEGKENRAILGTIWRPEEHAL